MLITITKTYYCTEKHFPQCLHNEMGSHVVIAVTECPLHAWSLHFLLLHLH